MQEMQEMSVWSLGQEDPLKKEMTTHLVFFSGESDGQTENPMEPGELQSIVWPLGPKEMDMTEHAVLYVPTCYMP